MYFSTKYFETIVISTELKLFDLSNDWSKKTVCVTVFQFLQMTTLFFKKLENGSCFFHYAYETVWVACFVVADEAFFKLNSRFDAIVC